jgi:hypothetical protein
MKKNAYIGIWIVLFMVAVGLLVGCKKASARFSNYQHQVEIAPEKWLTLKEESGKCWFVCEWKGKEVFWPGKRSSDAEEELPTTLREFEGDLFLITLDRENINDVKLVYWKINENGDGFQIIPARDFPKTIATQNMELDPRNRMVRTNDGMIDEWDLLRNLKIDSIYFRSTLTAKIWIELETGLSYQKIDETLDQESQRKAIREFAAKYKPVPLKNLVKN